MARGEGKGQGGGEGLVVGDNDRTTLCFSLSTGAASGAGQGFMAVLLWFCTFSPPVVFVSACVGLSAPVRGRGDEWARGGRRAQDRRRGRIGKDWQGLA